MDRLFPLHKLLIRTSGLVSTCRLAEYLHLPEARVAQFQRELGLPEVELVHPERAFPILLRRLHDLIPEEQIAALYGVSLERCRQMALDMDFLDVKLGARPEVFPELEVDSPGMAEAARMFAEECRDHLAVVENGEQPFQFLEELSVDEPAQKISVESNTSLKIRMMHSYTGSHGDFLLNGEEFYNAGILSRMRNRGVNAGWMPALLRDMAPSDLFPEFGEGHAYRIANLRKQVKKAASYGIRLFLYFNEPRFLQASFFEKYPETRGVSAAQPGYYGMCTSNPMVREWMQQSVAYIFEAVPELGGMVLITASENATNCFSHRGASAPDACPRCAARGAGAALTDCANLMAAGIQDAGSKAKVIQWLWAWDNILGQSGALQALEQLRPDVHVMVDWAKNTPFELFGKQAAIGEYTLAYVKPSDYAQEVVKTARSQGRKVLSKCALVSTVEMNALPYLPVIKQDQSLLDEHSKLQMDGLLGCWIFGAYPGRNMEMLSHLSDAQPAEALAQKYYGHGAKQALQAWSSFSEGMAYYPTVVPVLYFSAVNPGPGLKFPLQPEPWRWGMVAMATERLDEASHPFGPDVMIKGFRKLAECFAAGVAHLAQAIALSDRDEWSEENQRDIGICQACWHHFTSAANYAEFILTRNRWLSNPDDASLRDQVRCLLQAELKNAQGMLPLAAADSRMGYEGSIGYFYMPMEIVEKIYDLRCSIAELGG